MKIPKTTTEEENSKLIERERERECVCVREMANTVEKSSMYSSFVDARISFSNDFADSDSKPTVPRTHDQMKYKEAPVSSDFKFNVENYGFISAADEIFFGGVLLPLEKTQRKVTTTLREELSSQDSSDRTISKGSRSWWKLGLNKSKKIHSNNINFHLPHKSQKCLASILESDD